jgi:ribonuclease D
MLIITDTAHLKEYCSSLKDNRFITVDTEFSRDKTYYLKLCLIQVGDNNYGVIIDPLAKDIDLKPFLEILVNKNILKVFHACKQDLEIFYKLLDGQLPDPIFDTQIAASACGFGNTVSYESLVKDLLKIKLDKSHRVTDWSKRPLSKEQINYALGDVTHLKEVYVKIEQKLQIIGNDDWIREEMQEIIHKTSYVNDPNSAYKKMRISSNSKSYIRLIQRLAKWREETAQKLDIPRNFVIKDQNLLEIGLGKPKNLEEFYSIRNLESIDEISAKEIIDIINCKDIQSFNIVYEINKKRDYPKRIMEIEALKLLLKLKSQEHGIAEPMIASTEDLADFLYNKEGGSNRIMSGWRYEIFGKFAHQFRLGHLAIGIDKNSKKVELHQI